MRCLSGSGGALAAAFAGAFGARWEEYVESRQRLGVSAESVWLVPKPSGEGWR
jgi:hypothetical protein